MNKLIILTGYYCAGKTTLFNLVKEKATDFDLKFISFSGLTVFSDIADKLRWIQDHINDGKLPSPTSGGNESYFAEADYDMLHSIHSIYKDKMIVIDIYTSIFKRMSRKILEAEKKGYGDQEVMYGTNKFMKSCRSSKAALDHIPHKVISNDNMVSTAYVNIYEYIKSKLKDV